MLNSCIFISVKDIFEVQAAETYYLFDALHCKVTETTFVGIKGLIGCMSYCANTEELCTGVVYLSNGSCYYFNVSAGGLTPTPQPVHGSLGDEMVYFKVMKDLALCKW